MKTSLNIICFLLLMIPGQTFSQVTDATIDKWAIGMKSIDDVFEDAETSIDVQVFNSSFKNTKHAGLLLRRIIKSPEADMTNKIFRFRVMLLRLVFEQGDIEKRDLAVAKQLADSMLLLGYQTGDERVIAWSNWNYGSFYYAWQELEVAATYCSRALQKFDEGPPFEMISSMHCVLGEIMFHAGEYQAAILNTLEGLPHTRRQKKFPQSFIARYYNTVGQSYQRLNMPDSALYYFNISTQWASDHQDSTWVSINALNIGEIYLETSRWKEAKALFLQAYNRNKNIDRAMEANAQLALGSWYSKNNQLDSAHWFLAKSIQTSLQYRDAENGLRVDQYRRRALDELLDIYVKQGGSETVNNYWIMYRFLNDSLNKVTLASSIKSVELRNKAVNDELALQRLQKEKENEMWIRNLIIFIILSLSGAVIVYLNKQRRILKLQQQAERLKQEVAKKELADARNQLADFTQRLQEKSLLLDRLKKQSAVLADPHQYQEVVEELTQQTILTENDWQKFRNLFEKIEPEFFPKLRNAYPEITVAELRIAALTLLQIDSRQMAAMLGISSDSVRKSRQRLRQRLQVGADTDLFKLLSEI